VLPFFRRGTDTVPTMLTPGEIVLNAAQQGNVAMTIAGGSSSTSALQAQLAAIDRRMAERDHRMGERIAIAVRDAILQAG
jgi:hypothetical protein